MESISIVALSKNIGCTMDGKPLTSNERLQYLNGIIKDNNIIETNNTCDNNNNENSETQSFSNDNSSYEENCNTSWLEWSNSIWDFAQKVAKNSEYDSIINACYNPDFAKQIKTRLLPYLPIWTDIMRPCFNKSGEIETSSSVEAEFSDLKNKLLKVSFQ